MDAHLRWDWDILVLRRLGRWSQLRKRKCVLEVCFNIIKFDISNVQSTSLTKISVRLSGHHVAYKCKCVRLVIYVSLRWRSLQGSAALLFAVIYLTETSLAPSQLSPKASFPCLSPSARLSVCHKATFIYIYIYIKTALPHILHLISLTILVHPRCKTWPFDLTLWE